VTFDFMGFMFVNVIYNAVYDFLVTISGTYVAGWITIPERVQDILIVCNNNNYF
jgi:hypothetical protein